MTDYQGGPGPDNINQASLGLADNTNIFGDDGDDIITFGVARVIGGAGNDTLTATNSLGAVTYYTSTSAVTVNLATGKASDGLGGTDTLVNVRNIQGSNWNDTMIGSAADETFQGAGGSNTIDGGAGYDIAEYYFEKSTAAIITYNAATDTFTVTKNFTNGDKGVDTLTGIEQVRFSGTGSDNTSYFRTSFTGNFRQQKTTLALGLNFGAGYVIDSSGTGDFNGDGNADIMMSEINGLGIDLQPTYILAGDGHGGFTDITSSVFAGGAFLNKGGRPYVADLNNDGISDIFHTNFGLDLNVDGSSIDTHDGGLNTIAISNASTHKLTSSNASPGTAPGRNHRSVLADLTGDGYLDIVVDSLDQGTRYLINDGHGGFTDTGDVKMPAYVRNTSTNTYLSSGAFDVNNDGKVDLILNHGLIPGAAESVVLLNPGNGDFSAVTPVILPQSGVREEVVTDAIAIDLNGDNLPDMVRSVTTGGYGKSDYYQTSYLQFLINDGGGQFHDVTSSTLAQTLLNAGGWLKSVTVADFNRDGYEDILVNRAGAKVTMQGLLYLNNGNGTFTADQSFYGEPIALDADGDGMLDIAAITYGGTVTINLNAMTNKHVYKADFGQASISGSAGDDTMSDRAGNTAFSGGGGNDTITGGSGNDTIDGGANVDTAVFSGLRAAYTITQGVSGKFTVTGPDGTDTLTNVEYAKFNDQTVRLLPGTGASVAPGTAPANYMAAIRDFDGNNLTGLGTQVIDRNTGGLVAGAAWDGTSGWSVAGTADVSGSGATAQILFNNLIGRWAEVTTEADGKVYFDNHGWGGDTRIVGIYIDPEVTLGHAAQGGPNDSQRRFQNDLFIGNLKNVLGAGDYNHDGFQEVYFSLNDGTAYLHAIMWNDGNIQYANYQSAQQVQDYLTTNGVASSSWSSWLHEEPLQVFATAGAMAPPLLGQSGSTLAGVAV